MNWFRRVSQKRRLEVQLQKELQEHLERQTSDYMSSGVGEEEARRKARLGFGGVEQVKEECRDARGTLWLESTLQDLRLALRNLRKSPGFTFTALCTLALGIGANTAIFQLLDAVRLRSLPVPDPQSLALIQIEGGNRGFGVSDRSTSLSYPVWERIRREQQGFSGVFAWDESGIDLGAGPNARSVRGLLVTGGFFPTLGVTALRGHLFTEAQEGISCGMPGVVISYGFWRSEFGGRDSAIGSKLIIQDRPTEVVGVTPPRFSGLEVGRTFDIALAICSMSSYYPEIPHFKRSDLSFLTVMGRLKSGWTLAQARAQLASISPAIFQATIPTGYGGSHDSYTKFRLSAYPAATGMSGLREEYDTSLWLLLGITGLVLLIACANLANLMLVRATTREREVAVRLAIGASRWRLVRQLLTEGLLLAIAGAVASVGLAQIFSEGIVRFLSTEQDAPYLDLSVHAPVLLFTAGVALLTCLLFGLVPAFRGSRTDPGAVIHSAGRGMTAGRSRNLLQHGLVVSQIAISLVLLVAAALFVRSFWNLMTLNPGFRERGIVIAHIDFYRLNLAKARDNAYLRDLVEQVRSIPQVESVASATHRPLDGSSWTLGFDLAGKVDSSKFTWISPAYFRTMGIPLLAGREFNDRDTATSQHVAIVNQTFVRKFLHGLNPLGRTFVTREEPNYPSTGYEIVGIVKDTKYASLREEIPPQVFGPALQYPNEDPGGTLYIRSTAPAASTIAAIREKLSQISPGIRSNYEIFEDRISDGLIRERLMAVLSGFFGALAAMLAAVGLYGVISYTVLARRNEIGIRLALGASRHAIISEIVRRAVQLVLLGSATGLFLALLAARSATSLLFGLRSNDLLTLGAAAGFLIAVAITASFVPALRASRVDPMIALRYE
ncbi:MAG TPA: ABC transporter permease [Bryobacteraceae bacterium]